MGIGSVLLVFSLLGASLPGGAPESVQLVSSFSEEQFREPDSALWPAYFWLWNAPLDETRLRAQLRDMAAHDARSVCMLPMPHAFRPDSTNNSLDPDYLTGGYLARVRDMVTEAAGLKMMWWLYDEGGWPSGQALGKVVDGHPDLTRRTVVRERADASVPYNVPADALCLVVERPETQVYLPGDTWTPASPEDVAFVYRVEAGSGVDLLNPAATQRFIEVTHAAYARLAGEYFGNTIRFTFTDEPSVSMPRPPDSIPWFADIDALYTRSGGNRLYDDLPKLFTVPTDNLAPDLAMARIALYDALSDRFRNAYFTKLRDWCRSRGLASSGHLGGEDETLGVIKYGFGHLLRPLRAMDVPGVDLIWRQVFPGRENQSNFPVAAASVAHQNRTRFTFTESFCVYGNGLTPAQMKWLTDYQYIRGVNLLVIGCYPLSTEAHHMTGERPHFGAMNPLWDHLPGYHAYVARLGYALSAGDPVIRTALYYPARDMWAYGLEARTAVDSFEMLGRVLLESQCPYDLIDDDMLSAATIQEGALVAGAMRYDTVVCGDARWMHPDALARLRQFADAGGQVLCIDRVPSSTGEVAAAGAGSFVVGSIDEVARRADPLVVLRPPAKYLRVAERRVHNGRLLALFNEGASTYDGTFSALTSQAVELDLERGELVAVPVEQGEVRLHMRDGDMKVFLFSESSVAGAKTPLTAKETLAIDDAAIRAVACKQTVVGDRDFEIVQRTIDAVPYPRASVWKPWLTEDFSGEVDYEFTIDVPAEWADSPMCLETGPIEYAASVFVDGRLAGYLLWPPWRVTLPDCTPGTHTITLRVANTLANELTSERVTRLWAAKKGPGWPSPYHARAYDMERESRGGGLKGPIQIVRMGGTSAGPGAN